MTAGDNANDHTNFFANDKAGTNKAMSSALDLDNIEHSQWHAVQVVWDASIDRLTYWFDGQKVGTPHSDVATSHLGGSSLAHYGFNAGTGGFNNLQKVNSIEVDQSNAQPSNIAPVIISAATASVAENQAAAIDEQATDSIDSEGPGLIYSKTGGADADTVAFSPGFGAEWNNVFEDRSDLIDLSAYGVTLVDLNFGAVGNHLDITGYSTDNDSIRLQNFSRTLN